MKVVRTFPFISIYLLILSFPLHADDAIWSDTISVCPGSGECRNPTVALSGDTLWAAWESNQSGNRDIFARSFSGGEWSPVLQLTESDSDDVNPRLFRDRLGGMWFAWESRHSGLWKVYVRRFDGPAMTEAGVPQERITGSLNLSGAVDTANRVWLVWQSPGSATDDSADVYAKYYNGQAWSEPFNVTGHPADDDFPRAAADSTGRFWVVWRSDRSGNEDIYATCFDGEKWLEPPLAVATGPSGDYTPRITVDSRGRVWFAWMSNFNIFTRYYDGALSSVFQLTVGYFVHQNPCIIGDASSDLWVLWSKEESDANLYARYYNGEAWSPTDTASALQGNDRTPALAVDWMDNLWNIWEHEGDILLRRANIPPAPASAGFEPAGGVIIGDQRPVLRWDDADEPVHLMQYVAQVDDSDFQSGADYQYETPAGVTSVQISDSLTDNTRWYYRIETIDPTGLGSQWSEIQNFYVDLFAEAPHPPEGLTVAGLSNGQVPTSSPELVWQYGGDNDPLDTAEKTRYEIQIDDESCFCGDFIALETAPGDTVATVESLEENRTYYARVRAIVDGEDLPSDWSGILSFLINTENNSPVVEVISPNGGEAWYGVQAILWTAVDPDDEALNLRIAIDLSSDGGRSWDGLPPVDAGGDSMGTNDGSYLWNIPSGLRGRDFMIRATATDPGGAEASDLSDGNFLLSSLVLDCQPRLFSPNGDGTDDEVAITVDSSDDAEITVKVYDLAGRLVRLLTAGEHIPKSGGQHVVRWDGRDEDGTLVPDRLYIVAVTISDSHGTDTHTKTVMVLNR